MTIGERIRQARLHYGMSQAELARRIQRSTTAMNDIEGGRTEDPRWSVVVAIAHVLGVSLDQLDTTAGDSDREGSHLRKKPLTLSCKKG
jgi:transcriptional regulator with XRE-family HTH domain